MALPAKGDPAEAIAAIVLAAGFSSRMGVFKPLLAFGERTVTGHVVAVLREAGVRHIHVVTGCHAELMALELAALGAMPNPVECFGEAPPHPVLLPEGRRDACTCRSGNSGVLSPLGERGRGDFAEGSTGSDIAPVHNANFAEGMFTSVQAGVASLPAGIEGFVLLPVDVPLIRASTVRCVLDKAAATRAPIVHPVFRGERGHPPFIGRALFGEILESDGEGGLRAILARHEREAASVAVFDRGCLMDMDRPDDYRRLVAALAHHHVPDAEECEAILDVAAAPEPVRRHCRAVAALATRLARQLDEAGVPLDVHLVRAAALVHDIAKGRPDHAEAGAALVREFGFPGVADVVARHMSIAFEGQIDESAVVYLADKLIQGEVPVRLETRFAPALERFAGDAEALAGARQRYADAETILSAVEVLDRPAGIANRPGASYENGSPCMTCCDRHLHLGLTESVCPVCLATIPAERRAEGGTVYLKKTCPEHGTTSTPVWRGLELLSALGTSCRGTFPSRRSVRPR